ncbi:MAG: thioredoxin family protein [Sporichthyaceae bacterium]|nr:thioredoxin family protein [Sporichthyaceae bacterium]
MELTVLVVPDCQHAGLLEQRLAEALAGRSDVDITRRVIADAEQAERWSMRGSPTLLIDGVDPFATPGQPASLSCRLYRGSNGRTEGAPTLSALRAAIQEARQ